MQAMQGLANEVFDQGKKIVFPEPWTLQHSQRFFFAKVSLYCLVSKISSSGPLSHFSLIGRVHGVENVFWCTSSAYFLLLGQRRALLPPLYGVKAAHFVMNDNEMTGVIVQGEGAMSVKIDLLSYRVVETGFVRGSFCDVLGDVHGNTSLIGRDGKTVACFKQGSFDNAQWHELKACWNPTWFSRFNFSSHQVRMVRMGNQRCLLLLDNGDITLLNCTKEWEVAAKSTVCMDGLIEAQVVTLDVGFDVIFIYESGERRLFAVDQERLSLRMTAAIPPPAGLGTCSHASYCRGTTVFASDVGVLVASLGRRFLTTSSVPHEVAEWLPIENVIAITTTSDHIQIISQSGDIMTICPRQDSEVLSAVLETERDVIDRSSCNKYLSFLFLQCSPPMEGVVPALLQQLLSVEKNCNGSFGASPLLFAISKEISLFNEVDIHEHMKHFRWFEDVVLSIRAGVSNYTNVPPSSDGATLKSFSVSESDARSIESYLYSKVLESLRRMRVAYEIWTEMQRRGLEVKGIWRHPPFDDNSLNRFCTFVLFSGDEYVDVLLQSAAPGQFLAAARCLKAAGDSEKLCLKILSRHFRAFISLGDHFVSRLFGTLSRYFSVECLPEVHALCSILEDSSSAPRERIFSILDHTLEIEEFSTVLEKLFSWMPKSFAPFLCQWLDSLQIMDRRLPISINLFNEMISYSSYHPENGAGLLMCALAQAEPLKSQRVLSIAINHRGLDLESRVHCLTFASEDIVEKNMTMYHLDIQQQIHSCMGDQGELSATEIAPLEVLFDMSFHLPTPVRAEIQLGIVSLQHDVDDAVVRDVCGRFLISTSSEGVKVLLKKLHRILETRVHLVVIILLESQISFSDAIPTLLEYDIAPSEIAESLVLCVDQQFILEKAFTALHSLVDFIPADQRARYMGVVEDRVRRLLYADRVGALKLSESERAVISTTELAVFESADGDNGMFRQSTQCFY